MEDEIHILDWNNILYILDLTGNVIARKRT